MTVIDIDARARDLGLDPSVCRRALMNYREAKVREHDAGRDYSTAAVLGSLPNDEVIAVVRCHNLYRRMPDVFDWNGFVER